MPVVGQYGDILPNMMAANSTLISYFVAMDYKCFHLRYYVIDDVEVWWLSPLWGLKTCHKIAGCCSWWLVLLSEVIGSVGSLVMARLCGLQFWCGMCWWLIRQVIRHRSMHTGTGRKLWPLLPSCSFYSPLSRAGDLRPVGARDRAPPHTTHTSSS